MSAQRSASRSASRGRSPSGPSSSSISKVLQASGMKDVIIGKDKRSVFLPSLPSLNAPIHSRQNAFYRFSDELLRLEDDHTPAELMSVLQQEIPITSLVLCHSDAQDARARVLDAPFKVENLSFNKLWKKVLVEQFTDFEHFNDAAKRKEGLSAVQFECTIPVSDFLPSESTLQDHVMFFTLELPTQARTRNWADDGTPISDVSTVSTPARHTRASAQSPFTGVARNLFQTPTRPGATTPPPVTPTPPAHSKFEVFLAKTPAANVNPGDVTSYGYFDKLDFLDTQARFNDIFGFRPKLLASDSASCPDPSESLSTFADRIYLRTFIASCKTQYLGEDDLKTIHRSVNEIVLEIRELKQGSGTPDELYDEFTSKAANLPNECSAWGITLAHQFFYSLSSIIQGDLNEDGSFQLADPSTLQTKSDHLRALLSVRTAAQSAHLKLEKQKELMAEVVGSSSSGTAVAALQAEIDLLREQHSQHSSQLLKFQSQSPAESTLARYKGNHSTATRRVPEGHILFPINGVQHVKNTTTGYVSKYPFGYSGCFRCGDKSTGKGCWPRDKCPAYRSVSTAEIFAEFNCHIPNKKNVTGRRPDTPSLRLQVHSLTSAKRSKEVTVDESVNETIPPASEDSEDLQFAEEGDAVCVITAQLLNMSLHQRKAPIVTNNDLPFINLPLLNGEKVLRIKAHTDSCAALSVGSLRVHQYIMQTHPDVVHEYIQFDDPASFEPIRLSVATTSDKPVDLHERGALTAIVRYKTGIIFNGNPFILSIALGSSVAVNTIIGVPDIKMLGGVLDFVDNVLTLKFAKIKFRLHGGRADSGLPSSVTFDSSSFVRPQASQSIDDTHTQTLVTAVTMDVAAAYRNLPITRTPVSITPATAEAADILSRMAQPSSM
ncbi:predicted protein [Chaetoceros tenuissimus]|uniref:Uncharacterized protein n=1 Tax=Chaetoceros tenuissimus TaxID=426638 RepID=A0AAD3CNT0_9STRA|nr:predicted protein [Chaetoceros tenuissimus]